MPEEWLCLTPCSGRGACLGDGSCLCESNYAGEFCEVCAGGRTLYPECLEEP